MDRPTCKHCGCDLPKYRWPTKHHKFGYRGDNFFCNTDCGYWFAVAYWAAVEPTTFGDRIPPVQENYYTRKRKK